MTSISLAKLAPDKVNIQSGVHTSKPSAYLALIKLRIVMMVLLATAVGYFLGGQQLIVSNILLFTLVGTALTCAGGSALNHYLERDLDCKMLRTAKRPIPMGLILPAEALGFGLLLVLLGTTLLAWKVNLLTGFLALLTAFLYVLVYTPLKRITWLNTFIGAIPGAIPPMGGWAAATGDLDVGAWILFLILFFWQHPHFYAIAWIYREDYARGGFKMLPVVDPDGRRTCRQILIYSVLLIFTSILPSILGLSGNLYGIGAFLLGLMMLFGGILLTETKTVASAQLLMRASLIYLPALFGLITLELTL